ncbi:hypothetical protein [Oceanidesulfovibrio marinus]|uniref:TubC N-terminal docking domain-containing protein n=1 Tax=Oceanidesulfovibrio marinus TaxID=370038 RepID=A0ABX6NGZ1_9BACT|nr:hypothetical protein [Oceanidesulfovibrio marinus]QJT09414.1 hypothetical protein E8L03_10885 [Oceanidesulfovibrio marinus]
MSLVDDLHKHGVAVHLKGGRLRLTGLDRVKKSEAEAVLVLAKANKHALVEELQENALMREYPHLAPCPDYGGAWLYRSWCTERCGKVDTCRAWPARLQTGT